MKELSKEIKDLKDEVLEANKKGKLNRWRKKFNIEIEENKPLQ